MWWNYIARKEVKMVDICKTTYYLYDISIEYKLTCNLLAILWITRYKLFVINNIGQG